MRESTSDSIRYFVFVVGFIVMFVVAKAFLNRLEMCREINKVKLTNKLSALSRIDHSKMDDFASFVAAERIEEINEKLAKCD